MKYGWRDFEKDPPHNYVEPSQYEDDPDSGYFVYIHNQRPDGMSWGPFLGGPCSFVNGAWSGYESHMKTSPYPEDRIRVLSWISEYEVKEALLDNWRVSAQEVQRGKV